MQRQCAARGVEWGGDFSPLGDLDLARLLRGCWIEWRYVDRIDGEGKVVEAVFPPMLGIHVMLLARAQTPGVRRFGLRHGLAHVLHGDNVAFVTGGTWDCFEETVADLFACLDVLPDWRLDELRQAGYSEQDIEHWCYGELSAWTSDWDPERLRERVWLRLSQSPC